MTDYSIKKNNPSSDDNLKYFRLPSTEFLLFCEEKVPKWQFTIGALTLPIKVRFGEKSSDSTNKSYADFTGNISLGFSFGGKLNFSSCSINALGGFSLSAIPVGPETTHGFIESPTNQAAVTWHVGILAEVQNFQLGLFTGIDYLSGQVSKEWVYSNKPWLGIGIGYSFFNAKSTSETQNP